MEIFHWGAVLRLLKKVGSGSVTLTCVFRRPTTVSICSELAPKHYLFQDYKASIKEQTTYWLQGGIDGNLQPE